MVQVASLTRESPDRSGGRTLSLERRDGRGEKALAFSPLVDYIKRREAVVRLLHETPDLGR
jgi:hypothetical protein